MINWTLVLNLIPWIVMGVSLMGMLIIVLGKIPVLLKLPVKPEEIQPSLSLKEKIKNRLKGLKHSLVQPAIANWLEKILRKLRLLILKIDNIFINLIGKLKERSQVWTVRSRAWMEQHRMKKIQKLQILEKLDQAEVLETIKKAKEEAKTKEEKPAPQPEQDPIKLEEKKYIDLIAQDPRNIEAYRKLGFLYLEQSNKEDAKNCFRQVLKLNPDDFEVISKMKELG